MESLPESLQSQATAHLRNCIKDLLDDQDWDQAFAEIQNQLESPSRRAKMEIALGKADLPDLTRLQKR